jgi:tRNA G26 N,N-dimethylase Trm1
MVVPDGHELITEGTITMLYPKSENSVFYNPVQVQNRDLSVLMIGMYAERRMEKMWITKKRKELRKKMNDQLKDNEGNKEEVKKETKEERKARLANLNKISRRKWLWRNQLLILPS